MIWVLLGFQALRAAHGGSTQRHDVSVLDEPVADGVGVRGVAQSLVPGLGRYLVVMVPSDTSELRDDCV